MAETPRSNNDDENQYNKIAPEAEHLRRELKKIIYLKITKDNECKDLIKDNEALRDKIMDLEKEKSDLNLTITSLQKTERDVQNLKFKQSQLEGEIKNLKEQIKTREHEFKLEKEKMKNDFNYELMRVKSINDNYGNKIENIKSMEYLLEAQKNQIVDLENEKEKIVISNFEALNKKHLQNELKFGELKKKMKNKLEKTKSQVMELNEHNIDVATKITLMQNTQLIVELQYQTDQAAELRTSRKKLELELEEMKIELSLHNEIESALVEKNRRLIEKLEKKGRRDSSKENDKNSVYSSVKEDNTAIGNILSGLESKEGNGAYMLKSSQSLNQLNQNSSMNVNNNMKELIASSNLERKIFDLEGLLEINQRKYQNLKHSNDMMKDKIENFEKKFTNIFILLEQGLAMVTEEGFIDSANTESGVVLNIDKFRKGNFEDLNREQKYKIILMFMKRFMPLVNPVDLQNSDAFSLISNGRKTMYEKKQDKKHLRNLSLESDVKKLLPKTGGLNSLSTSVLQANKQNLPVINTIIHNSKVNVSLGQLYQNRKSNIFS